MEAHASRGPVIALVLGGGWKLGASFHAGVLLALRDIWGVDARSVDSITGTSAGAVTAGFVGAGIDADDLFRRETGAGQSGSARELMSRIGSPRRSNGSGTASDAAAPPSVGTYFDDLTHATWPSGVQLRFCAVDTRNGRVAALDADSGATPGEAIAASCSVPGLARPVRIGDRTYVDGAVRSVNNADTVAASEPDIVIVSAPMSVDRPLYQLGPMAALRNSVRVQNARECKRLATICDVITIEPTRSDIAAMGSNLNAAKRRERVARHAYATACEILEHERPPASVSKPAVAPNGR
ncbi:patatin-like phospholipase family protein [Ilumatobacter nonamiensis]|uniref:patatin-like phospholipase family protein n=1 Tax=Ilumatobacter nonamiensis TaxID=467093 RepID=UPI00034AE37B|nr:patatin-like phospholipase family protein [Ilumatobacter nonamiensis]